jgi:Bacterial RNA polymerase, alpha chain C terminal domain/Helix-turn-helix domain
MPGKISNTAVFDEITAKQARDLALPVSSLKLPNRATNALTRDGVHTVAQLAQRTEADLLGTPNFGTTSLVRVKEALRKRKLRLGMVLLPEPRSEPTPPATSPIALKGTTLGTTARVLNGYLTPPELAAQLGVCQRTLARWDRDRTGPPRSVVGRRILYRAESVTAWLAKRERNFDEESRTAGRRSRPRRTAPTGSGD